MSLRYQPSPVIKEYGLKTVHDYMYHIRNNAEICVRKLLRDVVKRLEQHELSAVDYLDDGTPVSTESDVKERQVP
jgi:5-oxoprolinase (ATP-hydrolysing)